MLSNQSIDATNMAPAITFNVIDDHLLPDNHNIKFPNKALPTYPPIVQRPWLPPLVVVTPLPSVLTASECTVPPEIIEKKA